MAVTSLKLTPYKKQPFSIGLFTNDTHLYEIENIAESSTGQNFVFSDLSYEFLLEQENIDEVQDVHIYINDVYEPSTFQNGRICFPEREISDRRIFIDCYGFVELGIRLFFSDGRIEYFHSKYLPVLVKKGQLNNSVKAMANYVYDHQESFLLNGISKPKNVSGLKDGGQKNMSTQIALAEEIARLYEINYGYFKANCRFHIEKVATVDRLERLQHMTPATLAFIASHPEQLKPVNGNIGVRIKGKVYQPEKTLSLMNIESYDIYENKIVLSFLRKMIDEVAILKQKCQALLCKIPDDEEYSSDYIYSSHFLFCETRKALENYIIQLSHLHDKFISLLEMYRGALKITIKQMSGRPRPTPIFLSLPQYNKIFVLIHRWFDFGIYDLSKEEFMLSFIKISDLYESYLLAKMIDYISERGYGLDEIKRYIYPVSSKSKYKNTNCSNTFRFVGENQNNRITLYYQPVIFNGKITPVNGIGVYRNNSIPVSPDNDVGANYYVPDFLVKYENEHNTKYLIIDAKFSENTNVRNYYAKDLVFKYIFSISPCNNDDEIVGLGVIHGKCVDKKKSETMYDKKINDTQISPIAEIIPLIEGIDDNEHFIRLDQLFKTTIELP